MLSLRAPRCLCPSPKRLPCRPLRVCDRVRLTQSTCAPMSSPGAAVCDRWRGGSGGVSRQLDPAHLYRVLGQQVRCCLPSASVLQRRWAPSYCVGRSTVRRPRVSNHLRVRVMMNTCICLVIPGTRIQTTLARSLQLMMLIALVAIGGMAMLWPYTGLLWCSRTASTAPWMALRPRSPPPDVNTAICRCRPVDGKSRQTAKTAAM